MYETQTWCGTRSFSALLRPSGMRLYVHFEPADEALAWTKRLKLPPVEDASACPSVRSVLSCFFAAYRSKFRPQRPPELDDIDVFVEFHQNAASRRLLPSLDVSVASLGGAAGSSSQNLLRGEETCDFELVATPRQPQRKVLGPPPPPALKAKKKCPIHAGNDEEDGRDPKLRNVLETAAMHMQQRKFRAARDVYRDEVLVQDPENPEALLALGDILVATGRREEAVDKFYRKCWSVHGGARCECKQHARLAFTSALRIAECYVEMEKFKQAVQILDDVQMFLRTHSGNGSAVGGLESKAFFPDATERLWMEEQMDVLKAHALYETKDPDDQEKAISLVMHLLPDLQAPVLNLDALLLYARIAHDRGKNSEALSMALRVLVGKANDQAVKKTLVLLLKGPGSMDRLQSAVPPNSPSAGAAYAFIATILKDYGAVQKSIVCFQQAQISDPQSASYALNHAHALEACCRYIEAYDVLISFFRNNQTLGVGSGVDGASQLLAGTFVKILDAADVWSDFDDTMFAPIGSTGSTEDRWSVKWIRGHYEYAIVTPPDSASDAVAENVEVVPFTVRTLQANRKDASALSEAELDLLACFFTIVKILFVNGKLVALPSLIRVLEPLRFGRELHRTTIRNEQAYYTCIAQLLSIDSGLERNPPLAISQPSPDNIYVCGDSHTLATAWRKIDVNGQTTLLRPALVTGLKHWHLRKESTFYPKLNFWRAVASIPSKSRVIFLFGEIDCREGILEAVEKCKYEVRCKVCW
ncbi:unnamed protein product [Phytophthora lilii]|uniref:Unnamed protein product n=1 Tax=Phytophthora lilii TaxID=2077276 RepID=A0A9W6TT93_9STRA|nr:unnamed protein product [Phytophthora lilii]